MYVIIAYISIDDCCIANKIPDYRVKITSNDVARFVNVIFTIDNDRIGQEKDMLKERFDIIGQLYEEIADFKGRGGISPTAIVLSPAAFEWLLAVFQEDERILGISPINTERWTYSTGQDTLRIIIDESLDDYTLKVS